MKIVLVILVCITIFGVTIVLFYQRFMAPLAQLEQSMRQADAGDLRAYVKPQGTAEMVQMMESYNTMLDGIRVSIDQSMQLERHKQDLEMQVLMSQINPHFLYNTLETIVWKAGDAGRMDISKLAASLGKLYRLSIAGGLFVSLQKELEHVQMYMNIQQSRYGNKVAYDVKLHGCDAAGIEVLKLILQPIVENSLLYGMEGLKRTLRIRISVRQRADVLVLTVTDNGVGMDEETLRNLRVQIAHGRKQDTGKNRRSTGIGMHNIAARLRLYAGTTSSLTVWSMQSVGTHVTLQLPLTHTKPVGAEMQDIVKMVKEETGIIIDFTIIPKAESGEVDKRLVGLQAGDELDLIYGTTAQLKVFYDAGVLSPIDEIANANGYNMTAVFGDSLPVYSDGQTYGLPAFNDVWCTFINTKVFENANVEVPTADGWTWEKYIETAQAISDIDNNIFGSLMLDYDCYNFMYALQKGAEHYKADGTSNYDDALFKESVEFFYSLGNELKIQPDITSYKAGVYPWNGFVSTGVAGDNGKYDNAQFGMFICGGWAASMLPNTDKYPRDWECILLPLPYPQGEEPSTLTGTGCYAIPSTSKNKEAAFEALKCIAENQYSLGYGRVPARIDLTADEITGYIENTLVPTYAETDGIPAEAFKAAWFDASRKVLSEKVVGPADTTISQIWTSEAPLYGMGQQSLDATMQNILERSNEAIRETNAS